MRRTLKPLIMMGIGAAVYSMNQTKSKTRKMDWIRKIEKYDFDQLISKKQWRKTRKKVMKAIR
ncbi:DUF3918 domain-containing protein [Alkalicoccobacillus plakortidis]|uniref:DUF3918 domain-containing protein n=1 Tax=Alkalicoccobacillus plakortidis TaxID=444060 RepID=A0ABT0XKY6_9BACI|nr:DUF3918 domain-containing protein [Alkalicoccobacillus plakortidis]MCM2676561.1 DUF3918 domain-containing protein [Alkalicoccobacillus plakortidis]